MIDKNQLRSFLKSMPVDWLLSGEPFVRYRILKNVFGRDENDKETEVARKLVYKHKLIREIFDRQNKDGYWGNSRDIYTWWPKKDTTFWLLGILADFGFTKQNRKIARACEYVFSTQLSCGGFGWSPPATAGDCFTGILTESLAKLGYLDDPRLEKSYRWLLKRQRTDGGFWCKKTGQPGGPRADEPSCAFATLCVVGALAQNIKYKESDTAKNGVKFLLKCWDNRRTIKYAGHDSQIGRGWDKLKYPFTDYRILKYLDTLSQFAGIRDDPRMDIIMDMLVSKKDDGRFYAESIHKAWSNFDFGQKKLPSRWITFCVYYIATKMLSA